MRDDRDFYCTPSWAVRALLQQDAFAMQFTLDPCAGNGGIVHALHTAGHTRCRGVEIDADLAFAASQARLPVTRGDGFAVKSAMQEVMCINPPFNALLPWLEFAWQAKAAAVLCRLGALASGERYPWWVNHTPTGVVVLSNRPSFTCDGRTDRYDYCWVLFQSKPIGMRWIHECDVLSAEELVARSQLLA